MSEHKEFEDLLKSVAKDRTFSIELCPRQETLLEGETNFVCKELTTLHLQKLIQTVVDNPLTQYSFHTTATQIFKDCIGSVGFKLNVIDRLLFLLEARARFISPIVKFSTETGFVTANLNEILTKLRQTIKENIVLFSPAKIGDETIELRYGIATLDSEEKLNNEIYKDSDPNVEEPEELRKVLGDAFVHEIAKSIDVLAVDHKILDFSEKTFDFKLRMIQSIPASLIQKVVEYIEDYKKIIEDCLTVDGHLLSIDGSLFSLR